LQLLRLFLPGRATTDGVARIAFVRVAIIDVGANTLRLLVATRQKGRLVAVREQRVQLGLGEDIEHSGGIGEEKLAEAAAIAGAHVRRARKLGCDRIEILVTSPGRQAANGQALVSRLAVTTRVPTRVLTPDEEGELAWYGAVAALESTPPSDLIAVCDVGGGSTQVVVGSDSGGPAWARSFDLGSLRLTRRALGSTPASPEALDAARAEVSAAFAELTPPLARTAIATGGTARALRKVVGTTLDAESLSSAARKLAKRSSRSIEETYGVGQARAQTLTAGTLILGEVQNRLGMPLEIGRGGIREGAALIALDELAEAVG
jgi:exopolyphosphatase / guanosine-5'-triphosphate,3'-diphosphate pyrophosphatase